MDNSSYAVLFSIFNNWDVSFCNEVFKLDWPDILFCNESVEIVELFYKKDS